MEFHGSIELFQGESMSSIEKAGMVSLGRSQYAWYNPN